MAIRNRTSGGHHFPFGVITIGGGRVRSVDQFVRRIHPECALARPRDFVQFESTRRGTVAPYIGIRKAVTVLGISPPPGCLLRGDGNRTQQTVAVGVVFLFRRIRAGPLVQQFPKGVILIESSVFRRTVAGNPELVVVSGIKPAGQGILLQNIDTGDLLRRIAGPVQGRQQYGCQDRNDRNDNHYIIK